MSIWAELKKVVNSDFSKPLNVSINELLSKSMVKSVQRGVITISGKNTSGTATINSVNTSKAVVLYTGSHTDLGVASTFSMYRDGSIELTSSTTITATRKGGSSEVATYIPYQVIEYA